MLKPDSTCLTQVACGVAIQAHAAVLSAAGDSNVGGESNGSAPAGVGVGRAAGRRQEVRRTPRPARRHVAPDHLVDRHRAALV